jgi:hypothetical protein
MFFAMNSCVDDICGDGGTLDHHLTAGAAIPIRRSMFRRD